MWGGPIPSFSVLHADVEKIGEPADEARLLYGVVNEGHDHRMYA